MEELEWGDNFEELARAAIDRGAIRDGFVVIEADGRKVAIRICPRCWQPTPESDYCYECGKALWWEKFCPLRLRRFATWENLDQCWPAELVAELRGWNTSMLGLIGKKGQLKTTAALLVAGEIHIENMHPDSDSDCCVFTTVYQMVGDLKQHQFDNRSDRYADAEVLILDDIGVKGLTEWERGAVHDVVDRRWRNERVTIWTGNFANVGALSGALDDRTADRLIDDTLVLRLGGQSLRRLAG